MLTKEIKSYINKSVLCWLATSNSQNEPNVSPKEMFTFLGDKTILIAHIASPNSVNNIIYNPKVCVSFVDIFIQKGFKLKGVANVINIKEKEFGKKVKPLTDLFSDKFPILAVIEIKISKVEKIIAPNYYLNSDTTEQSQVESAMVSYKVKPE